MKKILCLVAVLAITVTGLFAGGSRQAGSGSFTIGYASKSSTTPFWVQLNASIQAAAREAGVTVRELGPAKENDAAGQISVIEDFFVQDVDALIVAPADDVGVGPAVKKFMDAGKPVIAIDNGVTGVPITATVSTNNLVSSGAAAKYIADALGANAKVVTIDGIVAQGTGKDRKEGFVSALGAANASARVVNSIAADWVDDVALRGIEDLLNGNVDFNAVFAAWDGGALAAYQALKQAGRTDIMVVGHDAYEAACDLMIAGDPIFKASVAQNPVNMGKLAVQTTVDALNGKTVQQTVDSGYEMVTGANAKAYKDTNYR
ncbi:MAG: sugar ABC transporter substrate-binding protein [Treponema sp.]|jgi:ribose transport system substrate-binding protein|nr:sugar ABC transporter substrate-binding protein [Treponema sp.]